MPLHPYILYGLEVYGITCVSYMDKLTKMNNKPGLLMTPEHSETETKECETEIKTKHAL